jgi:hypothetical protein
MYLATRILDGQATNKVASTRRRGTWCEYVNLYVELSHLRLEGPETMLDVPDKNVGTRWSTVLSTEIVLVCPIKRSYSDQLPKSCSLVYIQCGQGRRPGGGDGRGESEFLDVFWRKDHLHGCTNSTTTTNATRKHRPHLRCTRRIRAGAAVARSWHSWPESESPQRSCLYTHVSCVHCRNAGQHLGRQKSRQNKTEEMTGPTCDGPGGAKAYIDHSP